MKPLALLNTLLAFFGGVAVSVAMHLYRDPPDYILDAFSRDYAITYISMLVGGVLMLLLGGLGCCAALEPHLKRRRVMLIVYMAVISVLVAGEIILGVCLVVRALWVLDHPPAEPMDSNLKQLLEEVSFAKVEWVVVAWLIPLFLLQVVASGVAGDVARRATNELRLRRRLAIERELTFL